MLINKNKDKQITGWKLISLTSGKTVVVRIEGSNDCSLAASVVIEAEANEKVNEMRNQSLTVIYKSHIIMMTDIDMDETK